MTSTVPHLVQLLVEEYMSDLQTRGADEQTLAESLAAARPLITFMNEYLMVNRPVTFESGYDANYGVRLGNHRLAMIAPNLDMAGTMARTAAVAISSRDSLGGPDGVRNTGVIPVDGKPHTQPESLPPDSQPHYRPAMEMMQDLFR